MTKPNQQLFKEARELKKFGYQFVWFKNSKVMVRKDNQPGTPYINITSTQQVINLRAAV